ncbi:hypothetical protein INT43_004536 [Umbelopsis isabellina]|uniref:Uncharacterized protein n=1 Tax=Mortierella isabellina TaxID=91625 RepID=A0A8H7PFW7_MORIS|nr:hypothetical protein INT43_004536 [Umbelopsis isabellina]
MTVYLILGRHGARIHPTSNTERDGIRYLPLLVLKDLIKSNLDDRIRYITDQQKTVVFYENSELHYIAISKSNSKQALLEHLIIIQNYLAFHYGPSFPTRLSNTQPSPFQHSRISASPVTASRLSAKAGRIIDLCRQVPYLAVQPVQISEDLRKRFRTNLQEGCEQSFVTSTSEKRKSSFGSAFQALSMQSMREAIDNSPAAPSGCWSHAMLWVQDKLLVRCENVPDQTESSLDSLDLLCILTLVQDHVKKQGYSSPLQDMMADSQQSTIKPTEPQMIRQSRPSNASIDTSHSRTPESIASSAIATPPSNASSGYAPSSFVLSSKSSASNVASITNVTPVVSFSTPPQLSLMLFSNQNQHINPSEPISISDGESVRRTEPVSISRYQSRAASSPSSSLGSNLSADHEPRPVSAPLNHHRNFPIPIEPRPTSVNVLSSSLPDSSGGVPLQLSMSHGSQPTKRPTAAIRQHHRSRSSADSLSKLLPPLAQEPSHDGKVVMAWLKVNDTLEEKCIYLGPVSDGVTVVVIYNPPKPSNANMISRQLRKLQTNLRSSLADFSSFLLTKEQTHFSMLSVITNYPGLAHFVYTDGTGIMVQPIITDLRHQAEAFGTSRWRDLTVNVLNAAVKHLFKLASQYRDSCHSDVQILGVPNDLEATTRLHYVYQKLEHGRELFALYLDTLSSQQVSHLHKRLAHDMCKHKV